MKNKKNHITKNRHLNFKQILLKQIKCARMKFDTALLDKYPCHIGLEEEDAFTALLSNLAVICHIRNIPVTSYDALLE
jgi:hypothetical protein